MATTKRKTAAGSKAGKTSPRFGSPEWRKAHGMPVGAKKKPPTKKSKK